MPIDAWSPRYRSASHESTLSNAHPSGPKKSRRSVVSIGAPVDQHSLANRTRSASGPSHISYLNDSGYSSHQEAASKPFCLNPQQAYYFLRALVRLELEYEKDRIHRLTLEEPLDYNDTSSVLTKFTDESVADDLPPSSMPLLSFVIKHLLNAPLFRSQRLPTANASNASQSNLFFYAGLSPILKSLKGLELSHQIDRGESGFLGFVIDGLFSGMEAFIAAGLNFVDSSTQSQEHESFIRQPRGRRKLSTNTNGSEDSESPTFSRLFFTPTSLEKKASLRYRRSEDVLGQQHTRRPASEDEDVVRMKYGTQLLRQDKSQMLPRSSSPNLSTLVSEHVASEEEGHNEADAEASDTDPEQKHQAAPVILDSGHEQITPNGIMLFNVPGHSQPVEGFGIIQIAPESNAVHEPQCPEAEDGEEEPTVKIGSYSLPHGRFSPANVPLPLSASLQVPDVFGDGADAECDDPFERFVVDHKTRRSFSSTSREDADEFVDRQGRIIALNDHSPQKPPRSFKRRFTLSFSKKRSAKDLKAQISHPSLRIVSQETKASPKEARYVINGALVSALELPANLSQKQDVVDRAIGSLRFENDFMLPKAPFPLPVLIPLDMPNPPALHNLKYGGFETDVVGIRESSVHPRSFIIRTRRPHRHDEYVIRTLNDFGKARSALLKKYPTLPFRNLKSSAEADILDESGVEVIPAAFALAGPDPRDRSSLSRLSLRFLDVAKENVSCTDRDKISKRARRSTLSTLRSTTPSEIGKGSSSSASISHSESIRRSLRSWLRDTLNMRGAAQSSILATLLLSSPVSLTEQDLHSIHASQSIDEERRADRLEFANNAPNRIRLAHMFWSSLLEEIRQQDGLNVLSDAIRANSKIDGLPIRFQKSLEWVRYSLANFLFGALVSGPATSFTKFERLVNTVPFYVLRQTFKLSSRFPLMKKALTDVFLAKPFGSRCLMQRLLTILLETDSTAEQLANCRSRISSLTICAKLEAYVSAPATVRTNIRQHALSKGLPLVTTIVRGYEEPCLDRFDVERVMHATKRYDSLLRRGCSKTELRNHVHVRLLLDMQLYLRLLSQERDAGKICSLLERNVLSDSLEILFQPIFDLIQILNDHGNLPEFFRDLQEFCQQLVLVVHSLRARNQDSQAGVRILASLLQKHEQNIYDLLHQIHGSSSLLQDFLDWLGGIFGDQISLQSVLNLHAIIPTDSEKATDLLEEIEQLCNFHQHVIYNAYQDMGRFYAGDTEGDSPIVIQGTGFGQPQLESRFNQTKPVRPPLDHIKSCLNNFRNHIAPLMKHYF